MSSIFATPQSDRKLNAAPAVCSCGHSIAEHFDCLGGKEAGCYHSDNAVFCPCNKDPEQVRLSILAARVAELEAALDRSLDALKAAYEMLDEAIEYVPDGRQRVETINSRNMVRAAIKALEGGKS
jgi:hypothetical protein